MKQLVVSGSKYCLQRKYAFEFRSSKWKTIKIKEWSDGKYTYVLKYVGEKDV